ncbi:MAG: asparagine--tRNA ligase [Anaerolineales bacterium]|nr:asparagine--tRNA ligase [Anaerolineales bacterium]MCB9127851.1 asparagine--tRNA ligase [Ardenticatenales bacterium]
MTAWVKISDVGAHVGETVTVKGWLYARTDKGKLKFLQLRDGSGVIQAVVFKKGVPESAWEAAEQLTQESSVEVTGEIRADDRALGGYELSVTDLTVVALADDGYPIQLKEHGTGFLMAQRHLWIRTPRQTAILRIRATIIKAIRDWLDDHGFTLVDTPILTPAAVEGTSTLFEVDYFGEPGYLTQSGQLYNEANIMALGPVYCFGPTFRAEKSKTRRHLTEFWMVEPEIPFADLEDLMEVEEQFVSYIVQSVLAKHRRELEELLERDLTALEKVEAPFPRLSYDEAATKLRELYDAEEDPEKKALLYLEEDDDFGAPHETALSALYDKPIFVYHYPAAVKAFYMESVEGEPRLSRSVDLLAPEGYGEVIGGGQRTTRVELLEQRIEAHGLPREAYEWYLDLRRYGAVPHSGFGLGVERTVAWICGLPHVRETGAFPRMLEKMYP